MRKCTSWRRCVADSPGHPLDGIISHFPAAACRGTPRGDERIQKIPPKAKRSPAPAPCGWQRWFSSPTPRGVYGTLTPVNTRQTHACRTLFTRLAVSTRQHVLGNTDKRSKKKEKKKAASLISEETKPSDPAQCARIPCNPPSARRHCPLEKT